MTDMPSLNHTPVVLEDTYNMLVSRINNFSNIRLLSKSQDVPEYIKTTFLVDDEIEVTFRIYDVTYHLTGKIATMRVVLQSIDYNRLCNNNLRIS